MAYGIVHWFKVNDTYERIEVDAHPTLAQMQAWVSTGTKNALIERVSILWKGKPADMLIHEEGLLRNLPFNCVGYGLYVRGTEYVGNPIVGDIVVFEGFELE